MRKNHNRKWTVSCGLYRCVTIATSPPNTPAPFNEILKTSGCTRFCAVGDDTCSCTCADNANDVITTSILSNERVLKSVFIFPLRIILPCKIGQVITSESLAYAVILPLSQNKPSQDRLPISFQHYGRSKNGLGHS